jgi:hypothetical protein
MIVGEPSLRQALLALVGGDLIDDFASHRKDEISPRLMMASGANVW